MVSMTVRDARLNLSKLLKLVERGEDVVIRNRTRPVARVTRVVAAQDSAFPDLTEFRRELATRSKKSPDVGAYIRADRDGRG